MSHVRGQERKLGLDILTGAVPTEQGMYGKGVTEIVDPGQVTVGLADSRGFEEMTNDLPETGGSV